MIRLTDVRKQRHGRTRLTFDTGQTLQVPSRVLSELDLEEEEFYDLEQLREDIHRVSRDLLPERARSYLAQYMKTTSEFVEHFTRKGYPEHLVEETASLMQEEGALDDEAIARRHVEQRLENKSYGRRKVRAELQEKGIDADRARRMVDELYPKELERRQAKAYVEDNDDLADRKVISRLKNRGFRQSVIRDLVGYPD